MQIQAPDWAEIEKVTLNHYNQQAELYWQGTKDHDVSENYAAFLGALPQNQALDILDLGCGPGRDVFHFKRLGHRPTGLDGSERFCRMARTYSGCEIWHQSFLNLALPLQHFDGIFANASLFHVPSERLPEVLNKLHAALRGSGVLFMSNPRGTGEGWSGDRYGHFMEFDRCQAFLHHAHFEILHHYYRPSDKPRSAQPWLALTARKQG